jgi:hypothetical protein
MADSPYYQFGGSAIPEAGTISYQAPTDLDTSGLTDALSGIATKHVKKKYWYRKYRRWAEAWRDIAGGALGTGDFEATDPLAQLQQQLTGAVSTDKTFDQNYNFSGMLNARQKSLATALHQRGAALGLGNALGGIADEAQRARSTLASMSLAAYRPMAFQAQQQLDDQTAELLQALAQAQFETEATIEGTGRSV